MASFQHMEGKILFSCNHDHWLSRWFICFLKFHFGEHPKTPQHKTEPCPNKKNRGALGTLYPKPLAKSARLVYNQIRKPKDIGVSNGCTIGNL